MRLLLTMVVALTAFVSAGVFKYSYTFNNTPVSEALVRISKDHPDVGISFIYKELDNYMTSAEINTDDIYDMLRRIVNLNPISVIRKGNQFYVEALQHGKFYYTGNVVGSDGEPVVAATVMLLSPNDSIVLTYGMTDRLGEFSIPCDHQIVIGKISSVGFKPAMKRFNSFSVGKIVLQENPVSLREIKIGVPNAYLYEDRSVYIPTLKQKRAAYTAQDLLAHMAIPQLRVRDKIQTVTGVQVDAYIDFVPATPSDLAGMDVSNVKRVEYYDYPSDPRFQGKSHVINFITQRYEYGGYLKGIYYDNFVISRQLNTYAKFQYKNMTYDLAGGPFFMNDHKTYENSYDSFRLPQSDGSLLDFDRNSVASDAKYKQNIYWGSLKALYHTERVTMSNMLSFIFDTTPIKSASGKVTYSSPFSQEIYSSKYLSKDSERINSMGYTGYWYFKLTPVNSITFNPHFVYTHTKRSSEYEEAGFDRISTHAIDHSYQSSGDLSFAHSFGRGGTLTAMWQGTFLRNITKYSGSANLSNKSQTYRIGPGVNYSFSNKKFYTRLGFGLHWDRVEYDNFKDNSLAPWTKIALQYILQRKHSASLSFEYEKATPSAYFRSPAVIPSDPFVSYTGCPNLVPLNDYRIYGTYNFIPNNNYNFYASAWAWIVDHRFVVDYEASPTGILRTVKQPLGSFAEWQYGVGGTTRQFDSKLQVSADIYFVQAHNGKPYNWNKFNPLFSASVYYYLNKVYFGAKWDSPTGYSNGCMYGTWIEPRASYTFELGWSHKNWKFRFYTCNFARYNTYYTKVDMKSRYYDSTKYQYNSSFAGFFQILATYTFSFGKKVKTGDEAYKTSGADSGILKQ